MLRDISTLAFESNMYDLNEENNLLTEDDVKFFVFLKWIISINKKSLNSLSSVSHNQNKLHPITILLMNSVQIMHRYETSPNGMSLKDFSKCCRAL